MKTLPFFCLCVLFCFVIACFTDFVPIWTVFYLCLLKNPKYEPRRPRNVDVDGEGLLLFNNTQNHQDLSLYLILLVSGNFFKQKKSFMKQAIVHVSLLYVGMDDLYFLSNCRICFLHYHLI